MESTSCTLKAPSQFGRFGLAVRAWPQGLSLRVKRGRPPVLLAGLTCTLLAIGVLAAGAAPSGVQGTVTLSPACGGAQREGTECKAPFADAELRLIADSGAVAGSTRTTSTGHYLLPAPAGRYHLQVMTAIKLPRCPKPGVVVSLQTVSVVDIDCDSGMR